MSIYTGSCLVTCIKTLGGNFVYDLVRVVGGNGISSKPWQVLSLITSNTYLVTASMVVKESYYTDSLNDAKAIYVLLAGKSPDLLSKFETGSDPHSTPAC
jgi:hypothetical protein